MLGSKISHVRNNMVVDHYRYCIVVCQYAMLFINFVFTIPNLALRLL